MLGYFCSFRVLEPHLLNDRTKAVDDKIEVFNAINIRNVENLEIQNNVFDEILFLIALFGLVCCLLFQCAQK